MPILVKDYTWSETEENVFITVPLKGVKAAKVDLLSTDEFVKANYPPFLFEVLLFSKINDKESSAKIRDGCVEFSLIKSDPGQWGQLKDPNSEDKSFMLKKKLEAVKYTEKKIEERSKEKAAVKAADKKYSLKEMMGLEEQDKSRIENEKENVRKKAAEDMEEWKIQRQQEEELERKRMVEDRIDASVPDLEDGELNKESRLSQEKMKSKEIFNKEEDVAMNHHEEDSNSKVKTNASKVRTSKPRDAGNIKFKFSPRIFPTPLRESKTEEEEAWLRKQAEARKTVEYDDPDLENHEKDPAWLRDKGNKLFASENFLAAINAYNLAIKMQPKLHTLYLNRSACHLKVRNLYKCIEDCSTALDLLQPPVPSNANARLKAHVRKGTAFCELELYEEGLLDYMAALDIDPNNEGLKKDAENIKETIQSIVAES